MSDDPLHLTPSPNEPVSLDDEIDEFLDDREARGLAPGTLRHYRQKLGPLRAYLREAGVSALREVTPKHLRGFVQHLPSRTTTVGSTPSTG